MRTITNDYKDAQILNLGSEGERGPYLVTQTGIAPSDPLLKTRMFVLRPDGYWVDFNAYASQGEAGSDGRDRFSQHGESDGNIRKAIWPASGSRPSD
jgi:hypothetical protein